MRLVVVSERLSPPYDEGIKNVVVNLVRVLAETYPIMALTVGGKDDEDLGIRNVQANRLLLSPELAVKIRRYQPQAILYVPTACGTPFSFLRGQVLHLYGQGCKTALLVLQPRRYNAWGRFWVSRLVPDVVVVQSRRTARLLDSLGCHTALLPPAVDGQRFSPVSAQERQSLRSKYGIPTEATVISHVGHLKEERNLSHLLALQATGSYHAVVVGSTSTAQEAAMCSALRNAGATVIDTYIEHIEDIYHLSEVYLFLAERETAAIELPLSVLEAMACNLPVISTPFGGLPDAFPALAGRSTSPAAAGRSTSDQGQGLFYWDGHQDLRSLVEAALSMPCTTRTLVEPFTWRAAARRVIQLLEKDGE
jgi:glycosyltransferase involved in cell wall biosynthesis